MIYKIFAALITVLPAPLYAELQALDDAALSQHSGQGGVYLSGELSINKDGGVLWDTPTNNDPSTWTANERGCGVTGSSSPEDCGFRVAVRTEASGGWYVLDNIKGIFSFEGLTLRTRAVDSGFLGDGAIFNQDVLELGLPNEIAFKDANFSFGVANQGGWRNNALSTAQGGDPSYQQTNIFSVTIDGVTRVQGNVLLFPNN